MHAKRWLKNRKVRLGSGIALAIMVGLLALLPSFQTIPIQPGLQALAVNQPAAAAPLSEGTISLAANEYIHTDAVKKALVCADPVGINNTPLFDQWRMPATGLTYVINTASIPSYLDKTQVVLAIQSAATSWVAQGAAPMVYGGEVLSNGAIQDGINTVGFGTTPSGTTSIASMLVSNGTLKEADITLDVTEAWATNPATGKKCEGTPNKFDIQNAMMHEFGHWIGAAHAPSTSDYSHRTMYPTIAPGELSKRTLSLGDIASIATQSLLGGSSYSGVVVRAGDDNGGP